MAEPKALERAGLTDLMFPEPAWTAEDLSRALSPDAPADPNAADSRRPGRSAPEVGGGSFTLREAHAHEWSEIASMHRPGFTLVVYRAGPGFVVCRKVPDSDLLHLRVCGNRVDVCRYLLEKMNVPFFAKFVWGFLGKVA